MKFLIMAVGAVFVGFIAWLTWPGSKDPTLFDMPKTQAYQLLSSVNFKTATEAPFKGEYASVVGNGSDSVTWGEPGEVCTIRLADEENATKTRVAASCEGHFGEGATDGFMKNRKLGQVAAMVDATLNGYAYDPALVGQIASKWPGINTDPGKAYGEMTGSALKMQNDMMRAQADYEQSKSSN